MNYQRAAIALGAGITALFLIGGTLYLSVIATLDFDFPGDGLRTGELLLVYGLLSAAVGVGSLLVTRALGGGWRRMRASAMISFIVAFASLYLARTSIVSQTGEDERLIALALLLTSVLSVLISTVRRTQVTDRSKIVIILVTVVLVTACVLITVAAVGAGVLIGLLSWVLLPALAGLLLPRSGRATRR